jgi:hypothetical protein
MQKARKELSPKKPEIIKHEKTNSEFLKTI